MQEPRSVCPEGLCRSYILHSKKAAFEAAPEPVRKPPSSAQRRMDINWTEVHRRDFLFSGIFRQCQFVSHYSDLTVVVPEILFENSSALVQQFVVMRMIVFILMVVVMTVFIVMAHALPVAVGAFMAGPAVGNNKQVAL